MGDVVFAGALPGQPLSGRQGGACSGDAGTSTDRPTEGCPSLSCGCITGLPGAGPPKCRLEALLDGSTPPSAWPTGRECAPRLFWARVGVSEASAALAQAAGPGAGGLGQHPCVSSLHLPACGLGQVTALLSASGRGGLYRAGLLGGAGGQWACGGGSRGPHPSPVTVGLEDCGRYPGASPSLEHVNLGARTINNRMNVSPRAL